MAFGDFIDFLISTVADKVLCNKAFNVARNPKYDGYQRDLASIVYKFLIKKNGRWCCEKWNHAE